MASINKGKTERTPFVKELEKFLYGSFMWEDSYYEKGSDEAERISNLVKSARKKDLESMVIMARHDMHIRHAPLFLINEMMKNGHAVASLIEKTVQRPDDLTELLAMYWKDGKKPIPNQLRKGIKNSLPKFSIHSLAKYQHRGAIKLVDLFNLTHPKPKDSTQEKNWKDLMSNGLTADTWESRLSSGENPKKVFTEMLKDGSLGGLAFLRNLRNMIKAGITDAEIKKGIDKVNFEKVLPFRFIAAARYAPFLESTLEAKMFENVSQWGKLPGKTIFLVDVSGSMDDPLSEKSDLRRLDAAYALAMLLREVCDCKIFTFSDKIVEIPDRRGFSLRDAMHASQIHGGTQLGAAINVMNLKYEADRLIVITDEQSNDNCPTPKFDKSYIINVASYKKGIENGKWIKINGFSERIVDFIMMSENI